MPEKIDCMSCADFVTCAMNKQAKCQMSYARLKLGVDKINFNVLDTRVLRWIAKTYYGTIQGDRAEQVLKEGNHGKSNW